MMCLFSTVHIESLIVNSIHEHFPVEMKHAVFSANGLKVIEVHLIIVKLSLCAINLFLVFHEWLPIFMECSMCSRYIANVNHWIIL